MFTTVAAFTDPIEAQLALGRLQAEGIPARLDDSGSAIMDWTWRPAPAGLVAPDRESASSRLALVAFLLLGLPLPWRRRARVERFLRRA